MGYEALSTLLADNEVEFPDFDYDQKKLAQWVIEKFSS